MKMHVLIEEVLSQEFEVEADSAEEAEKIAWEKYENGEFVLCPGNLEYTSIYVCDHNPRILYNLRKEN